MLLTCRVGVYASLSAPSVWLYLCLPPPPRLASTSTSSSSCASLPPHTLHCTTVSLSPRRLADDQGASTPSATGGIVHIRSTHMCTVARRPECIHPRRRRASVGTGRMNYKHIDTHQMAEIGVSGQACS